MSKMEFFTTAVKSSILEVYLTDFPKFASDWEIQFMKLKLKLRKLNYINYKHKYVFAKCALMTHSDQIEMYLLQQNRL